MDAFASPSIRPAGPLRAWPKVLEALLATLILSLSMVGVPGVPNSGLDASWQLMLIHAHEAGLQFGREVIFTWGPWGFLCNGYHMGATGAVPLLLWQTAGKLGMALGMVLLTRGLVAWRRMAFVVLFLAFHWLFLDTEYFTFIALAVVAGMQGRETPWAGAMMCAAALGFVAQLKFTYLVLSGVGLASAAACWALRGSWPRALALVLAFAVSFAGAWVAAGQSIDNLFPYVRRGLDIATGYGDAMGFDEPWPLFLWGAGTALGMGVFLYAAWRSMAERSLAWTSCGFLAFAFFVMWKESFTRADLVPLGGHVFGLFSLALILTPILPGLLFPGRRLHGVDALVPVLLMGVWQVDPAYYSQGPTIAWQRWYGNSHALVRLGSLPGDWQRQYEAACDTEALPAVRAAVGRDGVDVYNFSVGAALMNGLNVEARPIFQGYSAYTPSLEGWNLRHYQSPKAPLYLLWNEERIDDRFPGEDDAMLVTALAGHYTPFLKEGSYWLLRRTSPLASAPLRRTVIDRRTVKLWNEVSLEAGRGHAVGIQVEAVPTAIGRLRGLLYRPPTVFLTTTDDSGHRYAWRLLPQVARAGMLLAPVLTLGDDAAAFFRGEARIWVKSFHFEAPAEQSEFWSHFDVVVYTLPDLPLNAPGASPDATP